MLLTNDLIEEEALTMQKRRGNYKSKILESAGGDAIQYWGGGDYWHMLGAGTAEPLQWEGRQMQDVWEIWKRRPFWFDCFYFFSVKKKTGHQLGVRNGRVV